jgi:hypothetical protein
MLVAMTLMRLKITLKLLLIFQEIGLIENKFGK